MIDESSEAGVAGDVRCLWSTGVLGGDVDGGVYEVFGDVDGDMDDMENSEESREHSEQSKNKTQPPISLDLSETNTMQAETPGTPRVAASLLVVGVNRAGSSTRCAKRGHEIQLDSTISSTHCHHLTPTVNATCRASVPWSVAPWHRTPFVCMICYTRSTVYSLLVPSRSTAQ